MGLTTQQNLVLEQTQRLYDNIDRTGEHLDGKAAAILQAGSLIIALVGATTLPSLVTNSTMPWVLAGAATGFVAFIGMTICAVLAWRPSEHKYVGSLSWDNFFDLYISKELDDAYNQVLINLSDAIKANIAANERKARYVTLGTWLLVLQVAGILVIALGSAL
jgi:hypothetical protein